MPDYLGYSEEMEWNPLVGRRQKECLLEKYKMIIIIMVIMLIYFLFKLNSYCIFPLLYYFDENHFICE